MIYITAVIILSAIFAYIYLNARSANEIIKTIEIGNGKIINEFKDRLEISNACNINGIKFVFYEKKQFDAICKEIIAIEVKVISMVDKIVNEVKLACRDIEVEVISYKIESVTIHDFDGNCTAFIELPLNPEIKWGIEVDVNINSLNIEQIEFCH